VVHKGRESNSHGRLARRKHHFEHHLRLPRCRYPSTHGRSRRTLQVCFFFLSPMIAYHECQDHTLTGVQQLAMVFHHRGRDQYPCRCHRILHPARLARKHQMAHRGGKRDGPIPSYCLQRRQGRAGWWYLGRTQGCLQRPFHLDVLRHALQLDQRSVFQGFLPLSESNLLHACLLLLT